METRKKILLVEDEEEIRDFVKRYLLRENYLILEAGDGKEALGLVSAEEPDMIILDLMIPGIEGLEVLREIRRDRGTPILILSARNEETDRVVGLELGADDFVSKPFSPRELIARVKALLRRSMSLPVQKRILQRGPLAIDFEGRKARVAGTEVFFTPIEFALLRLLSSHSGKIFSREELLDRIWGQDFVGETRTVDVHVKNIRKKLESHACGISLIRAVRGVGYTWDEAK
ncbi:MAG: response regulator transcription factor [Candidatus Eremiobacteraeota bacterium]|nr:response regulator transcription factor [Candidatus Eremiobacteraeota bacterium]